MVENVTPYGLVTVRLKLLGRNLKSDFSRGLLEVKLGIDQPTPLVAHNYFRIMLTHAALREPSDDRLDDILQGHHSLHDTELINHEGDVAAGLAELLDQAGGRHRGRDEERGGEDIGEADPAGHGDICPEGLHGDHAADVVMGSLKDRIIGVTGTCDAAPVHIILVVEIEPGDAGPGGHQLGRRLLVEIEDALHHLLLHGIEGAALKPVIHHLENLFLPFLMGAPAIQMQDPDDG